MRFDWEALEAELREILRGLPGLFVDREQIEQLAAGVAAAIWSAFPTRTGPATRSEVSKRSRAGRWPSRS
jgi:hypothetical protein